MRKCRIPLEVLKERRSRLANLIGDAAFVLVSPPEKIRNRDVHYEYRQESSFYYFTGFEEPGAIMVFRPGHEPEYTLFVPPKDVEKETWEGFRFGPEGAESEFAVDKAHNLEEADKVIPQLFKEVEGIYYQFNLISEFDSQLLGWIEGSQRLKGKGATNKPDLVDPSEVIGNLRLIKQPEEIEWMQQACELSAQGHIAAMKFTNPGVNERQVLAVLKYVFGMGGAAREGYGSIVASGASATTLHYTFNDQECKDGDLLLIDAGAEFEYYTGDITRTFPVSGKFTDVQKDFYNRVLEVEKAVIAMVKPGIPFSSLQEKTVDMLVDAMIDLKLLPDEKEQILESQSYRKYYPHGVSHFLGMDVHDVGHIVVDGEPRKLAQGMMFTVEPGLYVPADDMDAPPELRGLGVRIEDNILVTEMGHKNMTSMVPREVEDIEKLMSEEMSVSE